MRNLMSETLCFLFLLFIFDDWGFHATAKGERSLLHKCFVPKVTIDKALQQHRTSLYKQSLYLALSPISIKKQ